MKRSIATLSLALTLHLAVGISGAEDLEIVPTTGNEVSEVLVEKRELTWVPGQIIVKYKSGAPAMRAPEARAMGLEHVRETSGGEYVYTVPPDTITALSKTAARKHTLAVVESMSAREDTEYAQLNYLLQIVRTPDDPGYPIQWHYFNNGTGNDESPGGINLPDTWDTTVGDLAVVITVIDTGILPNHPDITGSPNLAVGFDMISDTFTANDGDGRDNDPTDPGDGVSAGQCGPGSPAQVDSWHGTHVAGTVGVGNTDNGTGVAGVNWNSRVQPVRVLGRCGGSVVDINDAIRWAAGLPVPGVPTNATSSRVINMSLGAGAPCSASPSTQSAINDAVAAGVTVVVAAGNEAQDAANSFPASCDNVITVAASNFNGELVTRYSNFGAVVDIMAPGGDVQRDDNNDGNPDGVLSMVEGGYAYFNGTSMATPHVAGVAALLIAQEPTLTPQDIENLLETNALPRSAAQCPRPCGAGLLNADIAIGRPPPPPPLQLTVSPTEFELDEGDTDVLTATLTQGGTAVAGETVRFSSNDPQVATISPATATTDASGRAQATVTAIDRGNSNLVVSVPGQSQTTPIDVRIRVVPALELIAALLLALIIGVAGFRRIGAGARR